MRLTFLLPLSLVAGCAIGAADPTPPQARVAPGVAAPAGRVPTDVRRTTFIVRDMERSLRFWRDALGLKVNYDTVVTTSGVALPAGAPGAKARLVLLNANDAWVGWIGLMQWTDPPLADPGAYPRRLGPGAAVMVVNTDDVDRRCAAAAAVPGTAVTSPPRLQEYPGRNGGPTIRVRGCNVFDPDGTLVEINQILE